MRILLDTHAFLWFVMDSPDLSGRAASIIEDPNHEKFVSVASLWEIAIKVSTGKLMLSHPYGDVKTDLVDANGFELLPIDFAHTVTVASLPFHHKDPFDRLLIAQSLTEQMPVVSRDAVFDSYGVTRLW